MSVSTFQIDQCLFGYDDGHRLIAGSLALNDATATMTHLSDLAPGTTFGRSEGYWTGLPLPKLKRYALMYTWPAPEMPRPGCVWTHALLLDPSIFDYIDDLFQLQQLVQRPGSAVDRQNYRVPIVAELAGGLPQGLAADSISMADRLLDALYEGDNSTLPAAPGTMDGPLFAVWSQQWSRLRRNFRFQTAVSRSASHSSDFKFDVLFDLEADRGGPSGETSAAWKTVALQDLEHPGRSDLRSFLQRYGADVRKQRGSFKPLCEVSAFRTVASRGAGRKLLSLVERSFPEPEDALQLKQDVVDGQIAPGTQLEVLSVIVGERRKHRLPFPSAEGVQGLIRFWPDHELELMQLAEDAADAEEPNLISIFKTVTRAIPIDRFWSLTAAAPRVRRSMVEARPELLLSDGVEALDSPTLVRFIDLVPPGTEAANAFVQRMLARTDAPVVDAVFDRFPEIAARKVVERAAQSGHWPGERWFAGLVTRSDFLFGSELLTQLGRISLLYDIGNALGWMRDANVSRGLQPWASALFQARDDTNEDKRDTVYAFLLVLALLSPGDDARLVIEKTFSTLHSQIMSSRLSWKAQDILYPFLPEVGWTKNWDIGLRLRIAVAHSYVTNLYDPASFGRLELDRRARDLLAEAAELFKGGKKYEKAIRPK